LIKVCILEGGPKHMRHKNQTKRTKSYNRDFVRSALKLIYTFLANILFPEELLKALLKARGIYLSRLGNEGRRALKLLNNIDVDDIRKALREMGKKVLRETRNRRVAIDLHSQPQYHKDKSLLIKPTNFLGSRSNCNFPLEYFP